LIGVGVVDDGLGVFDFEIEVGEDAALEAPELHDLRAAGDEGEVHLGEELEVLDFVGDAVEEAGLAEDLLALDVDQEYLHKVCTLYW